MTAANPWGQLLDLMGGATERAQLAADPAAWAEANGTELWSKQREVMASVCENRRTVVRAGHGVSKSFTAAVLAAWWVSRFPVGEAMVVSTAPTGRQVSAILWGELRKLHTRLGLPGSIGLDNTWRIDGQLVAIGQKPADTDEVAFQGLHARHVLAVLDEAAGLPDALWDAVAGVVTSETSRQLAIGNPDRRGGRFERCFEPGSGWHPVHIPVTDTPAFTGEDVSDDLLAVLPSREWVADAKRTWGVNSPQYASRVLGEFPATDADALVSWELIRAAQARTDTSSEGVVLLGCDVARFGGDSTVIALRTGWGVRILQSFRGQPTTYAAGLLIRLSRRFGGIPVHVDDTGVGGGVTDLLNEAGVNVVPIISASAATDPSMFANLRAESYWRLRQAMEYGVLDLDPADDELAQQLARHRYKLDSKGRVLIESKDAMRARGEASPDRADAIALTFAEPADRRRLGNRIFNIG
ncbi:MAG: hypothetical protein QM711_01070 [Micropruina sp.]|uniref:hypothetical protein n=1 Tax=Micropruina sp. TaxID=2737536 RepID=UPI0039E22A75